VPVVYDSVGKNTFMKSLDCLAPLGLLAFFGSPRAQSSPSISLLAQKGSLFITRPTLQTYGAKREAMVAMAKELFDVVQSGVVQISINQTYPLKDVSNAHRDLEARKITGSTVLTI
jgi:NADPH2:quinone reductase